MSNRTTNLIKKNPYVHLTFATLLGVAVLSFPIAEAKTNTSTNSEPYSLETATTLNTDEVVTPVQAVSLTTEQPFVQTITETLEDVKSKEYRNLLETLESDTTNPEPSFETGDNSHLLVQATILNSETDRLTDMVTSLTSNIEADLEQIKAQAELKKKEEKAAFVKASNPTGNTTTTYSVEEFVASAKQHQFVNYDARTPSNLTGEELNRFIEGTELAGLGDAYVKAEQQYGVNAFVLMALSANESAWGKSKIAQDKNNLFGYMAYDRDPYNSAKHFATKEEGILTVANHLATNYLVEGAKYFNGYTLAGMNVRYASDKEWHSKITSIMNRLVNEYQQ